MGFDDTLQVHLAALRARDIAALKTTLPEAGGLTLVQPDGRISETAEHFVEAHLARFRDEDSTLTHAILQTHVSADLGFALVRSHGEARDLRGRKVAQDRLVSLVFQKVGDCWLLIFEQTTDVESKLH